MAELDTDTERALRSRIVELETLVEARTQAIVGLGAELAELRGDGSPVMAERLARPNVSSPNCAARRSCATRRGPGERIRCCEALVADGESTHDVLAALAAQLDQSRQQQTRLRDALTRVLRLVEEDKGP